MSQVFGTYAHYYDLFNSGKDYEAETAYLNSMIRKYTGHAKRILDLGCGTGKHAKALAISGYEVTGVDASSEMLTCARTLNKSDKVEFIQADIRHLDLAKRFDVAVSLFHVISYLTSINDLQLVFRSVKKHLEPGGVFIFDCWHGPAVVADPPLSRRKEFVNEDFKAERISHPEWKQQERLVNVQFDVSIIHKHDNKSVQFSETHHMRYWFPEEIEREALACGLSLIACHEWMKETSVNEKNWNALYILKNA